MAIQPSRRRFRVAVLSLIALLPLTACETIVAKLTGVYQGPRPVQEDLTREVVIVRSVYALPAEGIQSLTVDRVRFLEANRPHDVNRIAEVLPGDARPVLEALKPQVGDTLRISTRYLGSPLVGDLRGIPNWPGHRYREYPITLHRLTSVERVTGPPR